MVSNQRLTTLTIAFAAIAAVIAARGGWVQIIQARDLGTKAREIPTSYAVERAPRGRIYDRHGNTLAVSVEATQVRVNWSVLTSTHPALIEPLAAQLAAALDRPVEPLRNQLTAIADESRLTNPKDRHVSLVIESSLPLTATGAVTRALAISVPAPFLGQNARIRLDQIVEVVPTWKRQYPQGLIAGPVIGTVLQRPEGEEGLSGLELQYNDQLKATSGMRRALGLERTVTPTVQGADLETTLDYEIQRFSEQRLERALREFNAASGSVIVMETNTGAILAMASREAGRAPFDPAAAANALSRGQSYPISNLAISDATEPGSVLKPLTLASVIDAGKLRASYHDEGRLRAAGGPDITNLGGAAYGDVDAVKTLAYSINTVVGQMALDMGPEAFYPRMLHYGFTQLSNVDLPGEATGLMRQPGKAGTLNGVAWSPSDMVRDAFGQSMTATPIQVIAAINALANDCTLMRPYVVREVRPAEGPVVPFAPTPVATVCVPKTASRTRDIMERATRMVVEAGGNKLAIPGYTFAGKTGTADRTTKASNTTLTTYAGFIPANRPQLTILVKISDPRSASLAGEVSMPVWRDIAEYAVRVLGVAP